MLIQSNWISQIELSRKSKGIIKEKLAHVAAWKQCRRIEKGNPIMVFQMGKVGSSTVVKALEALSLHDPILHVHTLNPKNFDAAIARVRASINPTLPRHLFVSKFLIDKLSQKRFPCRVITLTREPVSRAFSFVFEDWKKQAPGAKSDSDLQRAHMCSALNRLLSTKNGISDPTRWFDSEVFEVFGFDVFSQPYDFEKGFVTYQKGSVSLLLIRLEDLDRSLPDALSEFLNIDASSVPKLVANQSSAKWYASSKESLVHTYRIPNAQLQQIFSSRYAEHFYSKDIVSLTKRWVEK